MVSSKGQLVIPKAYRQKLSWEAGIHLEVDEEAGQLVLRKQQGKHVVKLSDIAGRMYRHGAKALTLKEMDKAIVTDLG